MGGEDKNCTGVGPPAGTAAKMSTKSAKLILLMKNNDDEPMLVIVQDQKLSPYNYPTHQPDMTTTFVTHYT